MSQHNHERGPRGQEQRHRAGLRPAIEARSAPLLLALRRGPRWLFALVPVVLLLLGLATPGAAGAAALLVLVAILGWLAYLSWPSIAMRGRLLRALALLTVLALALLKLRAWI